MTADSGDPGEIMRARYDRGAGPTGHSSARFACADARTVTFLARQGMPAAVASIRHEHVKAFIAAELERTASASAATRYRSLQQFQMAGRGRDRRLAMARMRLPTIPEQPVPVLSDDQVRGLPAVCSGKDFRDRRDTEIIRLFLDAGLRLEAGRDIDRYIRARAAHSHGADPWLWRGKEGRLTPSGIYQMIKDRVTRQRPDGSLEAL